MIKRDKKTILKKKKIRKEKRKVVKKVRNLEIEWSVGKIRCIVLVAL